MTGDQLAGWLMRLAHEVRGKASVDGEYKSGPVRVVVPPPSTLRTFKQRHGSLDPPSVSDPSHDSIRDAVRDAFETHGETLLRRIRDAFETQLSGGAAPTFSQRSKVLEVVEEPDRSSRDEGSKETPTTTTTGETLLGRSKGEPPRPRKELLPVPLKGHEWQPMAAHRDYAVELGLSGQQFDQLLIELRDKHGLRPHTRDWWDDRCNRFIEARGIKAAPESGDPLSGVPTAAALLASMRAEHGS